jgi:Protein of unknown function (DUF1236)
MMLFPTEGDEEMRASKLITVSTVAILLGGTSLAIGKEGGAMQGLGTQRGATVSQGTNARGSGSEAKGPYAQASENSVRRSQMYGEPGSKAQGSRYRSQALANQRGQAAAGQGSGIGGQTQGQFRSHTSTGLSHAYGSTRNAEIGLSSQQRTRLRDMLSSRRDIPRVSNVDTNIRVGAVVPRSMRTARIPREVARMHPGFRGDRVFIYRDEVVVVDPSTFRIVAVLPT